MTFSSRFDWTFHSKLLAGLLIFFLYAFLISPDHCPADNSGIYRQPDKTDDGWETGTLNSVFENPEMIIKLLFKIRNGDYLNIHGVLLVKGGKLILEKYYHGFDRNKFHEIRSSTKSIGSILTGLAIDHGYLSGEQEKVYSWFKKDYPDVKWNSYAKEITVKSLLTMTSGHDCDDHGSDLFACEKAMKKSRDWLEFALLLPMKHRPGTHWAYNSCSLMLLSAIIEKSSGMKLPKFAKRYLFDPLGIEKIQWRFSPEGVVYIAGGARMKPRDMAKIGVLMLNNGKWKGRQILSQNWVDKSTANHTQDTNFSGYSYLWWTGTQQFGKYKISAFWASGNGGNIIFVVPSLDLVAVFTGGNYNSILEIQPLAMLTNYIIPALLPPTPSTQTIKIDSTILDSYVGTYKRGHITFILHKKHNSLQFKIMNKNIRLYPKKENCFFGFDDILGNFDIEFKQDVEGKTTTAVIKGIFQVMPFKKIKHGI